MQGELNNKDNYSIVGRELLAETMKLIYCRSSFTEREAQIVEEKASHKGNSGIDSADLCNMHSIVE